MNPKKKADLQRKLTLAQVPKPPADLAERIKRDIPPHLVMGVSSDRDRFTRSIFFDMRVAASVLLLVTSAFFAMQFFSHADRVREDRGEAIVVTDEVVAKQLDAPVGIALAEVPIEQNEDALDEWLAGPEAAGPQFSQEYLAFSAMRMAADFA